MSAWNTENLGLITLVKWTIFWDLNTPTGLRIPGVDLGILNHAVMSDDTRRNKNIGHRDRNASELTEDEVKAKLDAIRAQKAALLQDSGKRINSTGSARSITTYVPEDFLKTEHRFIRSEKDDLEAETSWEKRVAKSYSDNLYKEYALADLSRYSEGKVCCHILLALSLPLLWPQKLLTVWICWTNQIGLRWRLEKEVRSGKGEKICGNKACDNKTELEKYEVREWHFEDWRWFSFPISLLGF